MKTSTIIWTTIGTVIVLSIIWYFVKKKRDDNNMGKVMSMIDRVPPLETRVPPLTERTIRLVNLPNPTNTIINQSGVLTGGNYPR